jgi:outer membrane receptor protein involved in Fe transport
MAYRVQDELEFYANWGKGFHSNDVRGVVIRVDPVTGEPVQDTDLLVESEGAELGTRLELGPDFNLSLVGFWLDLDSELVFVGDAGGTEPNDGSRRLGLETSLFWRATDWLAINADYTYTDAEFRTDQAGGKSIPGAVESTFTLGLNAAWRSGLVASMRVRYLGEAPLIEDNTIQSDDSLLVNFSVAYRRGAIELALEGFNLLDSNDDDISYFYSSRLPGEPPEGIEDIHFHPLEPRTMRGSVTVHW